MQPREWSPPPIEPSQGPAAAPAETSARGWGALEYFVSFVYYMLFFGVIAGLLRSRFPIDLGLFLFFTNDGLIEWGLRKVGIRLVPQIAGRDIRSGLRVGGRCLDPVRPLAGLRARVAVVVAFPWHALVSHCRCGAGMCRAQGRLDGVREESAAVGRDQDHQRQPGLDDNRGPRRVGHAGSSVSPAFHTGGLELAWRPLRRSAALGTRVDLGQCQLFPGAHARIGRT